jgi:hypothetical protein
MTNKRDRYTGLNTDAERQINQSTGLIEDRLKTLEKPVGRAGIIKTNTVAKVGEFLTIEAPPTGLQILLPPPTAAIRNARITLSFVNINPVVISTARGTVNSGTNVTNNAKGVIECICDGISNWTVPQTVTSGGSVINAEYLVGAAHSGLTNERVATDTTEIDVVLTTPGLVTWVIKNGSVVLTKLEPIADDTFLGNISGGSASPTAISFTSFAGDGISYDATNHQWDVNGSTSIIVTSDEVRRAALTGDITASQNSNTTAFRVFDAKSVLVNATNSSAVPDDLAASTTRHVLRVNDSNNALEWGWPVKVFDNGEITVGDFYGLNFSDGINTTVDIVDETLGIVNISYDVDNFPLSGLADQSARTVVANATNASAPPTAVQASTARHVLRDNSTNTGLEWGYPIAGRANSGTAFDLVQFNFLNGTHTTASLGGTATDALVQYNVDVASLLAAIDSTSIVVGSSTLQRAALTGAVSAAQNSNSTLFAGVEVNSVDQTARSNLNFLDSTTLVWTGSDSAVNDRINIFADRAALTGAIAASQGSNATKFAGILNNGSATTDRTSLNLIGFTVADDAGNDRINITAPSLPRLDNEYTDSRTGAFDLTTADITAAAPPAAADVTRLTFTGAAPTLNSFEGGTDTGRVYFCYYNGSGRMTIKHSTAGPSGNESRFFNPGNVDFSIGPRDSFMLQANGTAGWRTYRLASEPFASTSSNTAGDVLAHNGTTWTVVAGGSDTTVFLNGDAAFSNPLGNPELTTGNLLWMDEDFDGSLTGAPVNSPATAGNGVEIKANANWRVGSSAAVSAAGTVSRVDGEIGHHGTIQLSTDATSSRKAGIFLPLGTGSSVAHTSLSLTSSQLEGIEFWVFIPTITNIVVMVGVGDQPLTSTGQSSGTAGLNAMFVPGSFNDWVFFNRTGGSSSATARSGVVVAANTWYRVGIRYTSTTVSYYINGNLEGVISTDVPTGDVSPFVSVQTLTTAARTVQIDRCRIWYDTGGMQL